ncbi:MAG: TonB-dependent receptor [Gammaproteobacteria bacterium]|nr:TonB-dependent receptor [Gammaproteobacteria bacterium]
MINIGEKVGAKKTLLHPVYKSSYFTIAVLLALLSSALVRAQDEELHVLIDDGQIKSRIGEVDSSTTSSANSVIEADRLRNNFVSLPDVLEQEVGVQMRSSGGEGSLSTAVLRGASSEQVIIYLDGVPLNNASGGSVDLSLIPVNVIERIEIYRGSTPLALGNPSIGGAVNIITRQSARLSADENTGQISASVASFHTYKLSGSSSISYDRDDVLLSACYLKSKNDFSFVNDNGTHYNQADDRVENRNNDGVEHISMLANWKYKISEQYDTELRLVIFDRQKEIPSATNNADVQTHLDTRQYDFLAQINVHDAWSKDSNLNLKLFATGKNEEFDDSLAQVGFFSQYSESVTKKLGVQFYAEKNRLQQQWRFITAISGETYDSESSLALVEIGLNTRDQIELSVENVSYFDQQRFILNIVARYQVVNDQLSSVTDSSGAVTPAFDESYRLLNPQIGAKYLFNSRTYLTANVGRYNRIPSFYELFGGDGLLLGNADLKQESSLNMDVGFTYAWYEPYSWLHDAEVYAGIYHNKIENLIVRIYNGQGIGVPQNISDAVIQGFESTIKLQPAANHSINANISLIDSVNKTDVGSFNGKVLPSYYQQSLSLHYTYALTVWSFTAEADVKRNMYYDRSNLLEADDVNLLNLSARRNFMHSNIDLRVDNILDENVQYFRNRPTPGLSFSLTYNHNF